MLEKNAPWNICVLHVRLTRVTFCVYACGAIPVSYRPPWRTPPFATTVFLCILVHQYNVASSCGRVSNRRYRRLLPCKPTGVAARRTAAASKCGSCVLVMLGKMQRKEKSLVFVLVFSARVRETVCFQFAEINLFLCMKRKRSRVKFDIDYVETYEDQKLVSVV